jgi:hypothetical protein
MSSPQYVYIPNLVGRQMLRIPVMPCDDVISTIEPITSASLLTLDTSIVTASSSSYTRDSSPARSVESVDELE